MLALFLFEEKSAQFLGLFECDSLNVLYTKDFVVIEEIFHAGLELDQPFQKNLNVQLVLHFLLILLKLYGRQESFALFEHFEELVEHKVEIAPKAELYFSLLGIVLLILFTFFAFVEEI